MRDILELIEQWRAAGRRVATATAVAVWGSAPRRPGARMAIAQSGEIAGSVSGGCVEGDVARVAAEVLSDGVPRLMRYTVTNDEAWSVGLSCGGAIEIWIEPPPDEQGRAIERELIESLRAEQTISLGTVIRGPGLGRRRLVRPDGTARGDLGSESLHERMAEWLEAAGLEPAGSRATVETPDGDVELFCETFPPRPRLIVVGAVHVAESLVRMAAELGFHTTVIDPRERFATRERFPDVDELLVGWPHETLDARPPSEATAVVVLTHDMKIDVPALVAAARSRARYVGVLGSTRTHARRVRELRAAGLDAEQIRRIHGPVGLPLGGRRPAEIALSILAQIVAVRHGGNV